jgi:hypothetical protein
VLADYVDVKLINKVALAPLARQENTLVGNAGDTLSFPKYSYIGKADVTNENGLITPVALSASKVDKKVQKITKAVQITDESRLSSFGNPVAEIGDQLAKSIADKVEDQMLDEMDKATLVYGMSASGIMSDNIVEALELFGEDADGDKILALAPADLTTLRKDPDYINGSEISTRLMITGVTGELWGTGLRPTNRLNATSGATNRKAYIVKPGAMALINKRGVMVESKREPDYQRDTYYASKMYVPYLYDESKIIKIVNFTGMETLTSGITSVAGTTAQNDTFIKISLPAPANYKWVYKLADSSQSAPTFGAALSGYTDWVSGTTEIAGGANTYASVCLVNAVDKKPVQFCNLTLTKKA